MMRDEAPRCLSPPKPLAPHFAMRPSSQTQPSSGSLTPSPAPSSHCSPSKMEALEVLGGYPTKPSNPRSRMVRVLLSMTVVMGCLLTLHSFLKITKSRKPQDFYSFEVKDAKGRSVSLERYRGKASLVVNVASHSEHTENNYRSLQELHRELGTSHFNVLAFPCGQFGETEMGTSRDIEANAKNTHGVTFPIFSKIKIMGSEAEPAFKFITDSVKKIPKWNFWKFLVNPEGQVVRYWKAEEPVDSVRQEATAMVREIILKKRAEL